MKKVFSFLLAFVMLLPLSITAFAIEADYTSDESPYEDYNEETERQIDLLIQELVKIRLHSGKSKNSITPASTTTDENRIYNSLRSLGAKIVGADDLTPAESGIVAQAASTPFFDGFDTSYNEFVVTGPLRRRHGRSGYHVVTVRVIPKDENSVLDKSDITVVSLYAKKTPLSSFVNNTFSIYAQKGVGQIPVVRWLPYEYLFMNWSDADVKNTKATYTINVNSATTAKYVYVADTDVDNKDSYSLSLLDHSVSYHEVHNSSYSENGVAKSKVTEKDYVIEGEYFASPDAQAYQNFLRSYYQKLTAPSAKYYEEDANGKEVLRHTVSAKSGLDNPYRY